MRDGDDGGHDAAHDPRAALSPVGRALHDRFVTALDDDLDLPTALAVVRETLRSEVPMDERRWLVLDADRVLGLDLDLVWAASTPTRGGRIGDADDVPDRVRVLVETRTQARADRDWPAADAARVELAEMGWDVTDSMDGPVLSRRPG